MKTNNIIAICAVIAIAIALLNISVTITKISNLKEKITGYATEIGRVNITIVQVVALNMTNSSMNWGEGIITPGGDNATLYTVQDIAPVVSGGNWTAATNNVAAFRLENIGNNNVSLTLQAGLTAHELFGSRSSTNEEYKWNVTNALPGSCNGGNFSVEGNKFVDVNTTWGETFCDDFGYVATANALYIDIWLTVPFDSANTTTELYDTITAIGTAS